VWWARRPLTPSRAAIVASLDPADTDPETFVRQLGIERVEALVNRAPWTLNGDLSKRVERDGAGSEYLEVDALVLRRLQVEKKNQLENQRLILSILDRDPGLISDPVLDRWKTESQPFPEPWPKEGDTLPVNRVMGDPAWAKLRIAWETANGIRTAEDKYGYSRAFSSLTEYRATGKVILDPTAGGGSIPFEALRLGHTVIANELNPVAATILHATLDYPVRFGVGLADEISKWGERLREAMVSVLQELFPASPLSSEHQQRIKSLLQTNRDLLPQFSNEQLDGFIFARQVTCPNCAGEAPLLNTCWLSKEAGDPWGVRVETDGRQRGGKISFEPYRVQKGKGPRGEDPNFSTVNRGIGQCIHCRQAITGEEIKAQARGESPHGCWTDRLYCVVAVRLEPKLDKDGRPQRSDITANRESNA
jgi:adenine-specific DNA methylase